MTNSKRLLHTADIVANFVGSRHLAASDLPGMIASVYETLESIANPALNVAQRHGPTPTEIRRSIRGDVLISFEDGRAYKTLRRHRTRYGLTPEAYRAKWGLPANYPMVSPAYSAQRSALARASGLGARAHAG